ncbi:hypothetical protein CYLTODRAFT_495558, partial [Cylindrobasidium torrendii FP15055 ss-10]
MNGTSTWALSDATQLAPPAIEENRGPTLAITWLNKPDDPVEGLAYGTAAGWLCIWTFVRNGGNLEIRETYATQLKNGKGNADYEIASITYDYSTGHLAVAQRGGIISAFHVDIALVPHARAPVPAITIANHRPQTLLFANTGYGTGGKDLWSVGGDGRIIVLSNNRMQIKMEKVVGVTIGGACLNAQQDAIVVDDVSQGPVLLRMSNGALAITKTFNIACTRLTCKARNVAFHLDNCTAIVVGSDHGLVYVLDVRTGAEIDVLETGKSAWVQTLDAGHCIDGAPAIVCAHSGAGIEGNAIQVWRKTGSQARTEQNLAAAPPQSGLYILAVLAIILLVPYLNDMFKTKPDNTVSHAPALRDLRISPAFA